MTFSDDIKSKHLGNYVLVTIGDPVIHRISTQKVTLGEQYYKPILLNIPSISESLDVENRRYKISSVRLSISDYKENGVRFSDSLDDLMNEEVNIWYASQSSQALNETECYLAGTFIIRSFTQDEDKIGLNCEDLSQDKLHKDLPLEKLGDDDTVPDKYKNKPIPMVFGAVDRTPCVLAQDSEEGALIIKGDSIGVQSTQLYIYREKNYLYFPINDQSLISKWGMQSNRQYSLRDVGGGSNIEAVMDNQILPIENLDYKSIVDLDMGAVALVDKPIKKLLITDTFVITNDLYPDITLSFPCTEFGEIFNLTSTGTFVPILDDELRFSAYKEVHQFQALPDHVTQFDGIATIGEVKPFYSIDYVLLITDIDLDNNSFNATINLEMNDESLEAEPSMGVRYHPSEGEEVSFSSSLESALEGQYNTNFESNWKTIAEFKRYNQLQIKLFALGTYELSDPSLSISGITSSNASLNINWVKRAIYYIIDKIHTSDFYFDAVGREGLAPKLQDIYQHILGVDILDFSGYDESFADPFSLGQYAFTISNKINSKKLLEEISASSGLFPYFKDGKFNVKSIKDSHGDTTIIIKTDDIIKYKFSRTSINKVYTKVTVSYHYDYGLKEFTKDTGEVTPTESGLWGTGESIYSEDHFGAGFDQELVFESKYIRDPDTAMNLAKYLCGLHANQHNLITLTLPLNYLELELGDIVKLDKLIQGRKMFGEDYTFSTLRNGQTIYHLFFIDRIKKDLDKVEIRLYQLHKFDIEEGAVSPVSGCTDPNAANYDPLATSDNGTCEYDNEVHMGCTNPDALNYNPEATELDGTCVTVSTMSPPLITAPEDGSTVVSTEEDIGTVYSDNLIPDPELNSTFDNNVAGVPSVVVISCLVNDSSILQSWLFEPNTIIMDPNHASIEYPDDTLGADWIGTDALVGYTLLNTSTGNSAIIAESYVLSTSGWLKIVIIQDLEINYGDGWQIISPSVEGESLTTAWNISNFSPECTILGGDETLILRMENSANYKSWSVQFPAHYPYPSDVTYKIEFDMRVKTGSLDAITLRLFNYIVGEQDGYSLNGYQWTPISFLTEPTGGSSHYLKFQTEEGTDGELLELEIDNVAIREVTEGEVTQATELVDPTVNVIWDHSGSFGNEVLDLTTGVDGTGWYKVFLSTLDGGTPATAPVETMVKRALTGFRLATFLHSSDGYTADQFQGSTVSVMDGSHSGFEFIVNTAYYQNQGNNDWLVLTLNSGGMSAETFATISQGDGLLITFDDGSEPIETIVYPPLESENTNINKVDYVDGTTFASHPINFGENNIPQNVDLNIKVIAYCNSSYSGNYVLQSPEGEGVLQAIPQAESSPISIEWVYNTGDIPTSMAVGNSGLSNTTIDNIEEAIDNPKLDINRLIDDIVGRE